VILIDANLLLYAYDAASAQHERAREWLAGALSGPAPVRLAWTTVLAFLRLTTNPRVFQTPFTVEESSSIVQEWLDAPVVDLLHPTERHWLVLRELLAESQCAGALVSDAHLAALAIEHGATLYSTDRDFTRFTSLNLVNPLTR
jgi:hypothetical protein